MVFSDDGDDDDNVNGYDDYLENYEDDDGSLNFIFVLTYMLVKFYKVETRSVEKYEAPDSKLFWSV